MRPPQSGIRGRCALREVTTQLSVAGAMDFKRPAAIAPCEDRKAHEGVGPRDAGFEVVALREGGGAYAARGVWQPRLNQQ